MLLYRLQTKHELSGSEQALADYVLSNTGEVCNMNIRTLAAKAFVSPATVTRFAQKMDFESFEQFRRQLYVEWTNNGGQDILVDADFPFEKDTPAEEVFERMMRMEQKALKATRDLIPPEEWERIINDIAKCRFIDIYGEGVSFDTAFSFKSNMLRIGYEVFMESDRSRQMNRCVTLHKDHFNLLLSYSGESERSLWVARFLHQHGCRSLSITSEGDNKLQKLTTYHLSIAKMEGRILTGGISNMCSTMSFTFILDLIYAGVFQKNYEENRKKIRNNVMLQNLHLE